VEKCKVCLVCSILISECEDTGDASARVKEVLSRIYSNHKEEIDVLMAEKNLSEVEFKSTTTYS
jgi:hypothetical protein